MKLLITGFDPFGGEKLNPAWEAVSRLPDTIRGAELLKLQVPTSFSRAPRAAEEALKRLHPDAVICVGQAGGRDAVTPEAVAVNKINARIPDNDGNQPGERPIDKEGPEELLSTLPVEAIRSELEGAGIPARISRDAGNFVCNALMYSVLRLTEASGRPLPAGFIHVPFIPEQTAGKKEGTPALPLGELVRALELTAETVIKALEK